MHFYTDPNDPDSDFDSEEDTIPLSKLALHE